MEGDDFIVVSALNHYAYCPRRCALIHVEGVYDDNVHTLRGTSEHARVDQPEWEWREGVRLERAMPLWCERLGLIGKADLVEFRADGTVYPVEFKHGPRKEYPNDDLQLCGQALCLEEMLGVGIACGAIYHHASRRRREVLFSEGLRQRTAQTAAAIRKMMSDGCLPVAIETPRCRGCSMVDRCMPKTPSIEQPGWLFEPAGDER